MNAKAELEPRATPSPAPRGVHDMTRGTPRSHVLRLTWFILAGIIAPFLVFGWGTGRPLGVFGAALATLVASFAAVVGLLVYIVRGKTP